MIDQMQAAQRVDSAFVPAVIGDGGGEQSLGGQRVSLDCALGDVYLRTRTGLEDGRPIVDDALFARTGVVERFSLEDVPEATSLASELPSMRRAWANGHSVNELCCRSLDVDFRHFPPDPTD